MPIKSLPLKDLQQLLRKYLADNEDPGTAELIRALSRTRKRGHLTKDELVQICRWKSPRSIRHVQRNKQKDIKRLTGSVFKTRSERTKLDLLLSLHGVGVPTASAILTLTNPKRYGVIDIRVWQLLHKLGSVNSTPSGVGFGFNHWYRFLMVIRYHAREFKVTPRDIERTMFIVHRLYQDGRLYR